MPAAPDLKCIGGIGEFGGLYRWELGGPDWAVAEWRVAWETRDPMLERHLAILGPFYSLYLLHAIFSILIKKLNIDIIVIFNTAFYNDDFKIVD